MKVMFKALKEKGVAFYPNTKALRSRFKERSRDRRKGAFRQ